MNRVINNIACGHKFLFFSSVVASHAWSKFSKVLDSLVLSSISRLFKFPRSARNPIKCPDTRRGNSKSNNNYKLHKSAIGFQIILSALACRSVCVAIFSCTFVWFYHSANLRTNTRTWWLWNQLWHFLMISYKKLHAWMWSIEDNNLDVNKITWMLKYYTCIFKNGG